jgi:hypothetical protein
LHPKALDVEYVPVKNHPEVFFSFSHRSLNFIYFFIYLPQTLRTLTFILAARAFNKLRVLWFCAEFSSCRPGKEGFLKSRGDLQVARKDQRCSGMKLLTSFSLLVVEPDLSWTE